MVKDNAKKKSVVTEDLFDCDSDCNSDYVSL